MVKNLPSGSKKNFKKYRKNNYRSTLELFCAKNGSEKHLIFEKWQFFRNGQTWPPCKDYRLCKIVTLGQKLNCQKHTKNNFRSTLELFCATNRFKKHLIIIRKMRTFPNVQTWPPCRDHRLCKIVTLAQKLKLSETYKKTTLEAH